MSFGILCFHTHTCAGLGRGGSGRVGGWGGPGGGGQGGVLAGRVGGVWYERSYSQKGCLYGRIKNALRNRVDRDTSKKVVVIWRKAVMTWRKVEKCWRKKFNGLANLYCCCPQPPASCVTVLTA